MPLKGRLQSGKAPPTPTPLRILGFWVTELVTKVRQTFFYIFLQKIHKPAHSKMLSPYKLVTIFIVLISLGRTESRTLLIETEDNEGSNPIERQAAGQGSDYNGPGYHI